RDYVYVGDVADAFLKAAAHDAAIGEVYNVGSGEGTRFIDMAHSIVEIVKRGKVEFVPWPENYHNVETGDFVADIGKISSLDWLPKTTFLDGLRQTYDYYSKHSSHYW